MKNFIKKINVSSNGLLKVFLMLIVFLVVPVFGAGASGDLPEKCDKAEVTIIARDFSGKFIPNLTFEIYEQVINVDGNPRPDKRVASGDIDQYLGKGTVFLNVSEINQFAIKIYDDVRDDDKFSFWYYNDLNVGCGGVAEVTEYLNGIKFLFQDADGLLEKDIEFSVYEQSFDDTGYPLKSKGALAGKFDTGSVGYVSVYLPYSGYTVDEEGHNRFVLEAKNSDNVVFTEYDIVIPKDKTKEVVYVFSSMKLLFKDAANKSFKSGEKVKIYEQDASREVLGKLVETLYTDSRGEVYFEYPAGTYVAQIEESKKDVNFFNLEIVDKKDKNYNLKLGGDVEASNVCSSLDLSLDLKRMNSKYIADPLNFELYEQETDQTGRKIAGEELVSGKTDSNGLGRVSVKPDEYKVYALKIYDNSSELGDYWFFNSIKFECGVDKNVIKFLPVLKVILRDGDGELVKNKKFSIYTQKRDADLSPVKEKKDLVSTFSTNEEGAAEVYVAPSHPYDTSKRGTYVLSVLGDNKAEFLEYNINIPLSADIVLNYTLSDIALSIKDAGGSILVGENIYLYEQESDVSGKNILGDKIGSYKVDDNGNVLIQHPAGSYALVLDDDLGQDNVFWDIEIKNRERIKKDIVVNLTSIGVKLASGKLVDSGESVEIYKMKEVSLGHYQIDKKLKNLKTGVSKYIELSLASGAYFFMAENEKQEYGTAFYVENGKKQEASIVYSSTSRVEGGQIFRVGPIKKSVNTGGSTGTLLERLKGRILLQVEKNGEAWYVDDKTSKRYYMKNGVTAYGMMRRLGLGITNVNLEKIPIGMDDRFNEEDTDSDGIPNKMEEALGTDSLNEDTDGDGYKDGEEVKNGYNPRGSGRLNIDNGFAGGLKGKILLQVESKGEAWYISPDDGRRYYMKSGDSAYKIMRFLSLGITNADLSQINEGVLD